MKLVYLMFLLFLSYPTCAVDSTVIKFNSREVEVCTSPTDADTCDYVKISRLPDPETVTIKVLELTQQGMVKLNINGKIKYIHQMDLKFSTRVTVSEPCIDKEFNSRADKNTYSTHGIMDKCDEK
ncbi:hypothetical protein [Aliivibrio kagoshimensis]|uniref:hypothetical protein n=1 Tax=Aliivibrio kagoshimensis TaxID=2910230 RepID=UPI003D0B1303